MEFALVFAFSLRLMKNAIVTGASKGLGRSIAEVLAAKGYRVWISARNADALVEAKATIEAASSGKVEVEIIDFADLEAVRAYAEKLSEACETIDVLVNNVGIYQPDKLTDEQTTFDLQMAVNFHAPYALTQALLPRFEQQKFGHIFNICSVVNRFPRVEAASYTISKFALWGYHKLLHSTLLPMGIKVCAFFPASINTASWDGLEAPKQDFVQPEDMAAMIAAILEMKRGTVPSEIDLASINPDY